jgi:hypothetical protein
MGNFLYATTVILFFGWAIVFFGYGSEGIIRILLVFAILIILFRLLQGIGFFRGKEFFKIFP